MALIAATEFSRTEDDVSRKREDILHAGEIRAQQLFGGERHWPDAALDNMIASEIGERFAAFLEAQPFFFIATADADGNCDASFRGAEQDASGRMLPALKVLDARHLMFPDFPGNGLFNSLGNLLVNPRIGMLFVDFARRLRGRINGLAEVRLADTDVRRIWPTAERVVHVAVEQAYPNCRARIPQLLPSRPNHDGVA